MERRFCFCCSLENESADQPEPGRGASRRENSKYKGSGAARPRAKGDAGKVRGPV